MIGERLKRARSAAGLSMTDLGLAAGVSSNMIKKYEHDESMPSSSVLIKLAEALGVRTEFFFRPDSVKHSGIEANTPQKVSDRIAADVLDQAERWLELNNLLPNSPIPSFESPSNLPSLEAFAREQKLLFEQLVYRSAGQGLISDSKAAQLLKIPVGQFRKDKMMKELAV